MKSIGTKVLLFVTGILVIAIIITAAVIMLQNNAFSNTVSEERVNTAAETLVREVQARLDGVQQDAQLIGEHYALHDALASREASQIEQAFVQLQEYLPASVMLADDAGQIIYHTGAYDEASTAILQETFLPKALRGESYTSLISGDTIKLSCYSVAPILLDGKVAGALLAGSNFEDMSQLDALKDISKMDFTIFAGDERIATTIQDGGKRVVGTKLGETVAGIVLQQGKPYVGNADILGAPYLCAYYPLKGADGSIQGIAFSGLPMAQAQEAQNTTLRNVLIILPILMLVFLGILFLYLNRTVKRPMLMLAEASRKLAQGNTDVSLEVRSKDEIGVVSASFQEMVAAIKALSADMLLLTQAAKEGRLSTRADAEAHQGDYRRIVEGVNDTLDAVIAPIQVAADALHEMSLGNLDIRVEGNYAGDHALIQNALNDTLTHIKGYIQEIRQSLDAMAHGDFSVGITSEFLGDFVVLKEAINTIETQMSDVMGSLSVVADQVAAGTQHVSDGSQAVSQGATEQASSIQELTATITEIAEQIRMTAENAGEVNTVAIGTREKASEGNQQMKQMQEAMEEINEASSNISKIIKVIDDIAFQTNILALNAAVEAARAGVHGKGFAVVAEEVRNLAAKSAAAAKETTDMIESSIQKTRAGTQIADVTAQSLEQIVEMVAGAVEALGAIASASNEQASGIAQVNKGIEQLSHVVQSNSATSEQSAAAAEELSSQAEILKSQVARFKVKGMAPAQRALPAPQARLPEAAGDKYF